MADATVVVEQLGLRPVVLVGQSLGVLTALSLAARRPDLVRALVLVDASPSVGGEDVEAAVCATAAALREWPPSFRARADAEAFFADRFGPGLAAQAWTSGLEPCVDGWRPRFDVGVMAEALRAALSVPSWDEWASVTCPTLVVRAGSGMVDPDMAADMARRLPAARFVEIAGAGHDVHLHRPDEWRAALTAFFDTLDGGSG